MAQKAIRQCRICCGGEFKEVIDFGRNPLVNSLIEKEDLDKKEPTFPLVVEQCQTCFLVQIVNPIDSNKIYREVDYLYFSSDMPGLGDYFTEYVKDVKNRFISNSEDLVVEIGSNDGLMLEFFKYSARILGVDPSSNVVVRAVKNGIPTVSDFFTERLAKSIVREFGEAKVIYGNNCIAHIHDLHEIMRGVKKLLVNKGVFIVECNYWGGMVMNKNYSLIYHDHFSYFTLKDWQYIAEKYDMSVFDAFITPAQGGSLRVFLKNKKDHIEGNKVVTKRCIDLTTEEIETNLVSYETAKRYKKEVIIEAKKLKTLISSLKKQGKTIAGYGAAAKGFSILKLAGITNELDYFVDDSPAKQGKYTPVTHIPVISREEAKEKLPDYFFITAPNYADVIIEKEKTFKKEGGKFILADSTIC